MSIPADAFPRQAPGPGKETLRVLPQLRSDPIGFLTRMAREYGGLVRVPTPALDLYLVAKPETIKHVLITNQRNYIKGSSVDVARPLIGKGLASSDGDLWRKQRTLMQPAFHRKRLASLGKLMADTVAESLTHWEEPIAKGEPIELTTEMMRLTLRVIVRTMFSTDVSRDIDRLSEAFAAVLAGINQQSFRADLLPKWLPSLQKFRMNRALKVLDRAVFEMIERRRASGEPRGDLLDLMLRSRDPQTGEEMSDQQLRDEVMTIFFAGHETTALTLTWAWVLLLKNTEVEAEMRAEMDELFGRKDPPVEELDRLIYTNMVLDETLRLYPPAWVFVRSAVGEDIIGEYRLPKNAFVMISPYIVHHDPELWEDPGRFDPERFSEEQKGQIPKLAYIPFGKGPRQCIGRDFALMEARLVLTMMAQRFHFELLTKEIDPDYYVTLRPKDKVLIRVKKR